MTLQQFWMDVPLAFIGIGSPGMGELIVIGVIAVILFGGKLPEVARTLGGSYQQFRKGLSDIQSSIKQDLDVGIDKQELAKIADFSDVDDDYEAPTGASFAEPEEDDDDEDQEQLTK